MKTEIKKTNAWYFIEHHRGYWAMLMKEERQCCGWAIGSDCERQIPAKQKYLVTSLNEQNGASIILCEDCAMKPAD